MRRDVRVRGFEEIFQGVLMKRGGEKNREVAERNVEGFLCLGLYVYENNLRGKWQMP